ncbi:MAG: aspartate/glutamate racemase family protein [Spirochaetes bacterium]|nr:aspartate/glutamate racemase family protein [Spirochaetota bacterium]
MKKKVGFIHTTPATIGMAERFMKARLPWTEYVHVYDGNVKVENFLSPIGVTSKINLLRWAVTAEQLERSGCDAIVSCCSLMPRATAYARQVVSVPFVQLDAIVLDRAVEGYGRIGVIKTTDYVVPYVAEGLKNRAAALGKKIDIIFAGDSTALDLFNKGEYERHDELVLTDVRKLADSGMDCVLMGQIPFGLMDEKLKALELKVPVLYVGAAAFDWIGSLIGLSP